METLSKAMVVKELSEKTGKTQKETKEIMETLQEIVFETMKKEGSVKLFDSVVLSGVRREARIARNPIDGSSVEVPEKTAPKCKFGKCVKDYINA